MVRACALEVLEAHRSVSFFPFLPVLIPEHAPFFFFLLRVCPAAALFLSIGPKERSPHYFSRSPPPPACPITLPRRPTFLFSPSI